MQTRHRWIHVTLEIIGALTVVAASGWLLLWFFFFEPMSHFSGGSCTDMDQHIITSPDGTRTAKFHYTRCGPYTFETVYLNTGNPNPGAEYVQIAELKNLAIGETSVAWKGSQEIVIEYPATADLEEAYAKVLGVQVTSHPR